MNLIFKIIMEVGQKVKVRIDDFEYLGLIIKKDVVNTIYYVSISALSEVIESDGSNLTAIN